MAKRPVKKAAAKANPKAAAPKAAAPKAKAAAPVTEKMTKTNILNELAARTELTRKQVTSVLDELESLIERHIRKKGGVGEFTLPGLLKVRRVERPATKKREGRNPATGETITIAAKKASTRVRVATLKRLKAMVE